MWYEVLLEGGFTARHGIRLPDGRVEPSHAHDWRVTVCFRGSQLDECGLLVDFDAVRADLKQVLARFEQTDLNQCPAMGGLNPTAEQVAKVIFEAMGQRWERDGRLHRVRVTEAPGCTAVYGRGECTGLHLFPAIDDP
jgi:6-pyruvoyltetrahydropterin/6-carboxytetrahydropterin synthase